MPAVLLTGADDEIADLIERVRTATDSDVGLVVPSTSRALQTPLNARLLAQFSRQVGRRTAIVSDDPRIQRIARGGGFAVYTSVSAFQRGMELSGPRPPTSYGAAGGAGLALAATGGAAAAVLDAPPAPPAPPAHVAPTAAAMPRVQPRRVVPEVAPVKRATGKDRRRILYFAGAAIAVIGLLLFLTLSPSAKITMTIAATPLSVSSTIQGSTDAATQNQPDHILTAVVTSSGAQQFQATPTGTGTIPATAAATDVVFSTDRPEGFQFLLPQGNEILTSDGAVTFVVSRATYICIGPNGIQPTAASCGGAQPHASAPVQDATAEARGNVSANTLTAWPSEPCPEPEPPDAKNTPNNPYSRCFGSDGQYHTITVTNPRAAGGGANAKPITTASASDLSSWTAQVQQIENQLTSQVNADMASKAGGKSFAVDPGGNGKTITFTVTPALPATGSQYKATQISVKVSAQAAIYDPAAVKNVVIADMKAKLTQGDVLAPGKFSLQPCTVTQSGDDGTVVIACSATDLSQPQLDLQALRASLTGKNPSDVQRIVTTQYDQVQSVSVSESPLRLFYLPFFASRIELDENFVTPASTSP